MNLSRCCWESVDGKDTSMDREAVENLSAIQKVSRWIKEIVEHLSRQSPEISMERDCINFYWDKKKEGLDRYKFVEDLSRSYRAWRKGVFQRREKHIKMNATSKLLKHRSNQHIKLSKHLSKNMQSIHRYKTHTHTHTH